MSFLTRLLGRQADPRETLRPLWNGIIVTGRARHWYADEGVADTVAGRFDMIAAVLAMVLLRMERDEALAPVSHHLTELFVEDMDGQLRELGVGDLMVGKHIGKLVGTLGGRLGALREIGEAEADDAMLVEVIGRNFTLLEGADPAALAVSLRALHRAIAALPGEELLAGNLPQ